MIRHVAGQPVAQTFAPLDGEGAPLALEAPATASIYDDAGVPVDTGSATIEDGTLAYTVAADKFSRLGAYSVMWTAHVGETLHAWQGELFEVVGGFYFTLAELRASDGSYTDETRYPDAKLEEAREWAEASFEHEKACAVAFVPRVTTERVRVPRWARGLRLSWPALRRVLAVTIDDVALAPAEVAGLAVGDRTIRRFDGWDEGSVVVVTYEHGYDAPGPQVRKAALMLAKEYLVDSALSSRATIESTDVGFYRLSIAGPEGRTGIPYVDGVIADNRRSVPVF